MPVVDDGCQGHGVPGGPQEYGDAAGKDAVGQPPGGRGVPHRQQAELRAAHQVTHVLVRQLDGTPAALELVTPSEIAANLGFIEIIA